MIKLIEITHRELPPRTQVHVVGWLLWAVLALGLVLALGCFRGGPGRPWPEPCEARAEREKSCRYVERILRMSDGQWSSTGWHRTGDLIPANSTVLVTAANEACVVDNDVAAVARVGQSWPCPGGWRTWRGMR